jgi:hypothetical protein
MGVPMARNMMQWKQVMVNGAEMQAFCAGFGFCFPFLYAKWQSNATQGFTVVGYDINQAAVQVGVSVQIEC